MSASDNNDTPDDKTVFAPAGGADADKTLFTPAGGSPAPAPTPTAVSARPAGGGIQVGDILNHIFEVRRYIARGGMGEVYEGININTEERVAIKVMLPALAADPHVQAMFRKEAKTLTRLSHPAVVQYRVLAQEPQLGALYIVTDFISGTNLSDVLGSVPRDTASLVALTRRLADGLRAAHELGAVHRDMSPDNVLLEDGKLERARIIDFGIAKDLDASKGTIVGDGFAGKLNYVAPEQLGDFGRDVGPWSDVYSLGLVVLALARGKDVSMGETLVDAVDKRRAGVDLSEVPDDIRPLLELMLRPNPKERLRSMDEVLRAINTLFGGDGQAQRSGLLINPKIAAAVAAVAIGLGAVAYHEITAPTMEQSAQAAVASALPAISCSWLDLNEVKLDNGALSLRFNGVAGATDSARQAVTSALTAKGFKLANVDFANVAPINPVACPTLDAYRAIKSAQPGNLISQQASYAMAPVRSGRFAGQTGAVPKIQISPSLLRDDVSLIGIESNGSMSVLLPSAAALKSAVTADAETGSVNPDGSIILKGFVTTAGWSGILAVSGKGPFDPALLAPAAGAKGPDWQARLVQAAKTQGWNANMVWFKVTG